MKSIVNRQKGSITTFFAFATIIISIIAGFFAYQNQKLVSQIKEFNKSTVVPSENPTSKPTQEPELVASTSASPKVQNKAEKCIAETTCTGSVPCMANPASVFCTCMGGKSTIKTLENGSQSGICTIDGKTQDEWVYYRSFFSDSEKVLPK